jgi:hypothetical protein
MPNHLAADSLIAEQLILSACFSFKQKTPPIACATRRGRNREEAEMVVRAINHTPLFH